MKEWGGGREIRQITRVFLKLPSSGTILIYGEKPLLAVLAGGGNSIHRVPPICVANTSGFLGVHGSLNFAENSPNRESV